MNKETYPKRIYLSASWNASDEVLVQQMAVMLAKEGFTVVQDHKKNQELEKDAVKAGRTWVNRAASFMNDCCGLVVIFPFKAGGLTTSPYLIPEVLAAAEQKIPILVFAHPGVQIEQVVGKDGIEFRFPKGAEALPLNAKELFEIPPAAQGSIDKLLGETNGFVLPKDANVTGPLLYPNSSDPRLPANAVEDFAKQCLARDAYPYVFNVLPFSKTNSVHVAIASAVFKATGMACHISLDRITGEDERLNWERMLREARLVIAELSSLRETCLFEAGFVLGQKKPLFLLSDNTKSPLPFGLDNKPLLHYTSPEEFAQRVKDDCCQGNWRTVFNLTDGFKKQLGMTTAIPGIPQWLDKRPQISLDALLTLTIWSVGLSVAFGLQILIILVSPQSPLPNFLALTTACTGFLALTRVGREIWERKIGKRLNSQVPWYSLAVAILLALVLVVKVVKGPPPLHLESDKPTAVEQSKSK